MSEALSPLPLETSLDTVNVTSSLELEGGVTLCGLLDGPILDPVGLEAVPVSPSPLLDLEEESKTVGTYGLNFIDSSQNATLQQCLESKLRDRLARFDSIKYDLIWKPVAMPSGPPICALLASVPRMSAKGSIGLPTPQAMDAKGYSDALRHKFRKTGHLKHWVHGTALAIHSKTGVSSWPNPMFVEWMMGFPRLWVSGHDYGLLAIPSCPNLGQSS